MIPGTGPEPAYPPRSSEPWRKPGRDLIVVRTDPGAIGAAGSDDATDLRRQLAAAQARAAQAEGLLAEARRDTAETRREVAEVRREVADLQCRSEASRGQQAAEVADLRRQLLEARKLGSLGELLGTTTHEFNNALTTILNYARMGLRHRDQQTRDKALERILSAGTRAAKITASVLSMSRNRSARMEPTDLGTLVEDVLVLLEREMMKYRVQVEREFVPVPRISANPSQLQQVLLNLMVNARQAMPTGGRLILRLVHDAAAGLVDLTVRDTGCGMTPEVMRRIFDPLFTTKSGPDETGKGGTGLGLASCREIVEAHRGRIRVESAPGKGTAITIRFPVRPAASDAGPVQDRAGKAAS